MYAFIKRFFSLGFHGRGAVLEILTSDNTNGVLSFTHFVMQQQVQLSSASAFASRIIGYRKRFKLNLVIDCVPFVRSFHGDLCRGDIIGLQQPRKTGGHLSIIVHRRDLCGQLLLWSLSKAFANNACEWSVSFLNARHWLRIPIISETQTSSIRFNERVILKVVFRRFRTNDD